VYRILPVKQFAARKRMLVAQSDLERQTLLAQIGAVEHSLVQLKKRFAIFGLSSAALSIGASIAGIFFARRKATAQGSSLVSKIFSGLSVFNQLKSLFNRVKSSVQTNGETVER